MTTPAQIARLRTEVGQLVAQHAAAKDLRSFAQYADDPAGFMRDVLRCEPWSMQVRMAEMVRDHARSVVVTCNGLGKDWTTARLALWWIYARRGFVVVTGPTERQVKQIVMREVRRAFTAAPELPGELYALELRVDDAGECGLLAFTSDNADRLTGFHHPRLLICVTEGQGVADDAYEAALSCATGPENRLFVYGNPTRPTGQFYRAAHSSSWNVLTIPASQHPNVITGRSEIPGAVSCEFIETMREEYGEASSIYRSRVLAQFPEESIEGLFKREWLRAAFDRHEAGVTDRTADVPVRGGWDSRAHRATLALDVARFGSDASAIAVLRCDDRVEQLITWRGASITDSADRLIHEAGAWGDGRTRPSIVIDETGLGGGCVDIVRKAGWQVVGFNGAAAPHDDRFLNARAEAHWKLRDALEQGRIALPRSDELLEECMAVEWQLSTSGKIQILGKDAIRGAIGRSPDRLDAVTMALWHATAPVKQWGVSSYW